MNWGDSTRMSRGSSFIGLMTVGLLIAGACGGSTIPVTRDSGSIGSERAMAENAFWAIVERTLPYEADHYRQLRAFRAALNELPPSQIEAFEVAYWQQMNRAYTWDLWGAAYVANGGASDDGFEYFRSWLISKGRRVFEAVVAKPDDLADHLVADVEDVLEFEDFAYVAGNVWTTKSGKRLQEFRDAPGIYAVGLEPKGAPFAEDAASLAAQYPKLWGRFGEHPLE